MSAEPALSPHRRTPSIALSGDGAHAAIASDGGVDRIALPGGERQRVFDGAAMRLRFAGDNLWAIAGGRLRRLDWPDDEGWPCDADELLVDGAAVAFAAGHGLSRIDGDGELLEVALEGRRGRVAGFAGRGLFGLASAGRLSIVDLGGRLHSEILVGDHQVRSLRPIFGGRFAAAWMRSQSGDALWVLDPRGALVHRIELPPLAAWTVAPERGAAVVLDADNQLRLVCLRAGRVLDVAASPLSTTVAIDTDSAGDALLIAGIDPDGHIPLLHLGYGAAFGAAPGEPAPVPEPAIAAPASPPPSPAPEPVEPIELGAADVGALAAPGGRSTLSATERASLLDVEIAWWKAQAARVIARQWERGVLGARIDDQVPFESEVLALAGARPPAPVPRESLDALAARAEVACCHRAEIVAAFDGVLTPMDELAARFDLSKTDRDLLSAALAPAIDVEVRRLYAIATGGDGWATEALLAELVAGDRATRLIAAGLLIQEGSSVAAPLRPREAVLRVLRESPPAPPPPMNLGRLFVPDAALEQLACALATGEPRITMRGARGRGRVALARHLASLAGNFLDVIDAGSDDLAAALVASRILGHVPCVIADGDSAAPALRTHRGPLVVCVPAAGRSPLEAGSAVVDLAPLSDRQRRKLWLELLPGGDRAEVAALATRFHIPPAAAMAVVDRLGPSVERIDRALRASLGEALRSVAEPVTHLPRWPELAVEPELAASLRELIGRRRHFDRVCFDWGMDAAMRSARGLVALFSGPPGTGKTLAAGLVARELDRPLYRVDLSRVVSKWIGETEKHLATLFDAAEQADAVILFDEADSLFARRTAVKGANDRNANLEVNYILQRLDTFRGVAILTTNQKSSIDPAFRRRLTAQLHFTLPDAETRERLWRVHLPKSAPVDKAIDFADLAERYPFTGGQIRNIAIRAAFLAAGDDATLSQPHFERAIELEYRERGKLSASGRLE